MNPLPRPMNLALSAAFAALMVATRFNHFGDALHLPDASMALYFLGGLYLRRHWQFVALLALAVTVDWVSIEYAGVSDFCVTPSYAFLPLAYAVLWYGGRLFAPRLDGRIPALLAVAAVALASASLSFLVSNGAFYWLGGRYADPNVAEYLARAWQWGPLFVGTTMAYVAVALAVHGFVAAASRGRAVSRAGSR